jgi:hypothetical protein
VDYVIEDGERHRHIWFLLPTHKGADKFDRVDEHSGLHGIGEPIWVITDHGDGTVSASPSIGCGGKKDEEGNQIKPYYWHGYLDPHDVWREV